MLLLLLHKCVTVARDKVRKITRNNAANVQAIATINFTLLQQCAKQLQQISYNELLLIVLLKVVRVYELLFLLFLHRLAASATGVCCLTEPLNEWRTPRSTHIYMYVYMYKYNS